MRFLPITADSSYAVVDFFIMVAAVAIPSLIFLVVWLLFFKNRRRRKRKRRHEHRDTNAAYVRRESPPAHKPQDLTDQPES
jgi:uncharacterized membrane protein